MECLACGDCCLRMSPLTDDDTPCPRLENDGDYYFCSVYERRPEQCVNHRFPARFCPIGVEKLGLDEGWKVAMRIDLCHTKRNPPSILKDRALIKSDMRVFGAGFGVMDQDGNLKHVPAETVVITPCDCPEGKEDLEMDESSAKALLKKNLEVDRIEVLQRKLDELQSDKYAVDKRVVRIAEQRQKLRRDLEKVLAQNDALRDELRYYADEGNWSELSSCVEDLVVYWDGPKPAQKALIDNPEPDALKRRDRRVRVAQCEEDAAWCESEREQRIKTLPPGEAYTLKACANSFRARAKEIAKGGD